ncbi:GAF and ANTAR domain-containing protein [Nocardioides sp. CER19]|uniref:ANTAR domain-containing protein n=1 Tax=Nocardioides sp. CER19 TaxID=3038538 RepID=UPI00244C7F11|nr:GAF and ANTAR domain-containing protein [Nocardioides sp. CER19]MDH2414913.1 GAF and ANTAR domain-containing protein [Nocardioides sp. CER19]
MTEQLPFDEAAKAFRALAELVYQADSYAEVYDAICRTALSAVPGCDRACVMTMRAGEPPVCEAATDPIARRIDEMERQVGEGPCVDAILTQRYECDADISIGPTWPRLAERVLAETPVRGMVGYRILVGSRKAGALNLFSDTPGAFTAEAGSMGAIMAAFASVALAAAAEHESARSLRDALDSNREIGKAIGLMMATHGISDEDAFNMLRDASSKLNLRLAIVARRLVEKHNDDAPDAV